MLPSHLCPPALVTGEPDKVAVFRGVHLPDDAHPQQFRLFCLQQP